MFDVQIQAADFSAGGNQGSFLQTPFWGAFKARHGWTLIRFKGTVSSIKVEFSLLLRSFARGFFSLAYVPMFPSAEIIKAAQAGADGDENAGAKNFCALLNELAAALKPFLPKNAICVRFDPELGFATPQERDGFVKSAAAFGSFAKKSAVDIQPPDTTQVDLTRTEEEILAAMKNKWRYNIKLAEKKGVAVQKAARDSASLQEALDIFYDLYKVTAARDGIAMHAKSYYQDLLASSIEEERKGSDVPQVNLYIAKHESDKLGAIMTLFSKTEAVYLYGCSSNAKRNLMPNFLLQWTAMKDAKAYGSRYYDMYGMPPTDDPNHPMHGLYLFKTGFGGRNVHRVGTYDVPLKGIYKLCVLAEGARAFWHKKVLKKIRGR